MLVNWKRCMECGVRFTRDQKKAYEAWEKQKCCSNDCAVKRRVRQRVEEGEGRSSRSDEPFRKAAEAHGNLELWKTAPTLQRWWLERFTMPEIRLMYGSMMGEEEDREPVAPPGLRVCENEDCKTYFMPVRPGDERLDKQQRFCSSKCQKKHWGRTKGRAYEASAERREASNARNRERYLRMKKAA